MSHLLERDSVGLVVKTLRIQLIKAVKLAFFRMSV